ncbi:MAG: response regulator transcription factor [Acidobacteriota bacterium]|nr:response regulator transcription factor [Acidobacteriota bacterium]
MESMQPLRSSATRAIIVEASLLNCELLEVAFRRKARAVTVVATTCKSDQALGLIEKHKPDVALISAQLDGGRRDGWRELLTELRSVQSPPRAVVLLASRERELVIDAFRCGAHGVAFRDEGIEILGRCIRAVHRGQVWASSEQLGYLLEAFSRSMPAHFREEARLDILSKRQKQVVRLVAEGLTNRDIAAQLRLSEHTVRNYLFEIFNRTGVSTRVELVRYYLHDLQNQRDAAD